MFGNDWGIIYNVSRNPFINFIFRGNFYMELEYTETIIKTIDASDLPVYTVWNDKWFYRVRNVEGRIVCDKLYVDSFEYQQSSLGVCLSKENKRTTEDAWRNAMHKFMNFLRK